MNKRNRKYTNVRTQEKKTQYKVRHQVAPEERVMIPKTHKKNRQQQRLEWMQENDLR